MKVTLIKDVIDMRWRVGSLLFAVLVIVALPYWITRNSMRETLNANAWVIHSAEVKATTHYIAYLMRDSESSLYRLLAGSKYPKTKIRARRAGEEVPGLLLDLRGMTRDDPNQQVQFGMLEAVIGGRLGLMAQTLQQLESGDHVAATDSLATSGALFPMDALITQIVHNEDNLLQGRRARAQREAFNGTLVLAFTAVAQGLLLAIMVVMSERQINRRRRAELRESDAVNRSRLIVQAVREPIALLDGQLRTLLVNTAFSDLYGEPGIEQHCELLGQIGKGAWDNKALLQRLNDVWLHGRELWDYEMCQRTIDGSERRVLINARRLRQPQGDVLMLLTVSDITARTLVEQQVSNLNRQLQGKIEQISDVNRELEAFSYSVSHDLRAPLRHIAGFANKLGAHLGDVDEKSRHYLDVITQSARRMALLVDDLLVFSRLGRSALRMQPVDMQSLVEEARELAEVEADGRRLQWRIEPLPVVVGDENMLRTVWQNLLSNAVKYTAQREIGYIDVSARRADHGDGFEFTVADNGAGFDMQYADKLFGVFQRLHRASEFPGNGIGLANVRRIIMRHGGRTWAEAKPEQGAQFHFSLPAHEPAPTPLEKSHEQE